VDLEIIDVLIDPKRALRDRILMTPMLVRLEPAPERRVLGNLSNRAALLDLLALDGSKHG
jgi:circadian clock protein KaiB